MKYNCYICGKEIDLDNSYSCEPISNERCCEQCNYETVQPAKRMRLIK